MRSVLLSAAKADIRRATLFYAREGGQRIASEFTLEVEHALSLLTASPEIGSPMRSGARKLMVRRFPYGIIYRVRPDQILVLAVGHQRRHPDFWVNRG